MYLPSLLPFILISAYVPGVLCAALAVRSPPRTNHIDGFSQELDPLTVPVTTLSKRVVIQDGMGFGWLAAWEHVEVIVPVEEAARGLEALYSTVIDKARGEWAATVAQKVFSRQFGQFHLYMYCQRRPIPWQFIATFAERMLGTMQQQPSMYRIRIFHPNGRTVVRTSRVIVCLQCSHWGIKTCFMSTCLPATRSSYPYRSSISL